MTVTIVAARALNDVIGKGSEIPWKVKGEQKLFREITDGGVLIMGRKTYDSIGRPLPGRVTIIVTRNVDYHIDGCTTKHSLDEALSAAKTYGRDVFVVGGGEIYREVLSSVDGVHLSTIQTTVAGDVFFPTFPTPAFRLISERYFPSNIDYLYQYYERVT